MAETPQFVKYAKRTIMRTGWVVTDVDIFFMLNFVILHLDEISGTTCLQM